MSVMHRVLIGVIVVAGAFSLATATATANWTSLNGVAKITKGLSNVGAVVIEGGGGTVECSKANGVWQLESSPEAMKVRSSVQKWVNCKLNTSLVKGVEASIGECSFELKSPVKDSNGKIGGNISGKACVISASIIGEKCEIKLPASKVNEELEDGLATNEPSGVKIAAAYGGITDEVGKGCLGIIKSTKEAKLKAEITEEELANVVVRFESNSGKYPATEESAPAINEFVFKDSENKVSEKVVCERTQYTYDLERPSPALFVEPFFHEGTRSCKVTVAEKPEEAVKFEINEGCWFLFAGVNPAVMGMYPAIYVISLRLAFPLVACEIHTTNRLTLCKRMIKPQIRQTVTLQNLAGGELGVKIALTNMEDEVLNANCPGEASGMTYHLDEYKGETKLPKIKVA